ncbi:aspartyl-tRNA(Asn)/glutamyl-tRNA(Gln) amidotransferase subunit A [Aliiruegeria haliotis]|uniref:Aspartyl-tRNA(Asn)/glutamyl-tRNA(Gln) amidotransferase subunit A n=1 Tax=Aliiruegeria haliotis TaxID=1280846 RepID=A0A2T0RIE1_9RHOB|nr:amidase family protein [Aliiruegeria haliotis]PRY20897.1 aspartyl-tRNA(Asn)/glutamyl-tRNA(Gln) amidotransferase subunit A [Aliiruegeria haliotis]
MDAWLTMSAGDLGRGINSGEIDPVALTECYLDAIEAHEFTPRIYARMTRDRALSEAGAAAKRARLGLRLSLLDGVPISWKDLFDTAGVETEAGSALLQGRKPETDAEVLRNATQAGLVCLGKTHMTELAFSGLGLNPVTATPPCVNDHAAAPGGSSSGAATSVAFGLAVAGIGSDTGGSVRVPSAWNDLVGLKTTSGRLSLQGVVPLCARFDTVGPLCRTVEDAALMLAALEGSRTADLRGASLQRTKLAILTTTAMEDVRKAPLAGFRRATEALAAAGATVEEIAVPEIAEAMALSPILFASEAYGTWKAEIEAQPDLMHAAVRERFRGGKDFTASDYVAAWQTLDRLRARYLAETAAYDAVLVPTCPIMPPDAARLDRDPDFFVTENLMTLRNTRIGNLMGLCGLTLPTGVASTGLMMLGAPMAEERLLRLGAAAEAALKG